MQTNTWMPVPATHARPGWPQVLGWYFAGTFAPGACLAVIVAVGSVTSAAVASLLGQAVAVAGLVALVRYSGRLPRRSRIALWLGVITPFVLAAAALACLLWAIAHSNWQF